MSELGRVEDEAYVVVKDGSLGGQAASSPEKGLSLRHGLSMKGRMRGIIRHNLMSKAKDMEEYGRERCAFDARTRRTG